MVAAAGGTDSAALAFTRCTQTQHKPRFYAAGDGLFLFARAWFCVRLTFAAAL